MVVVVQYTESVCNGACLCLQPNATWLSQLERAVVIWRGGGMSIQGVRSCGDYMFSGHTVVITLLNFFFTECESAPHVFYFTTSQFVSMYT